MFFPFEHVNVALVANGTMMGIVVFDAVLHKGIIMASLSGMDLLRL